MHEIRDRREAGRLLAEKLRKYEGDPLAVVAALPRGGVVVGYEIATALSVPLEILVVRKLGVPWQPELAMGAIATGGEPILNEEVVRMCGVTEEEIAERVELEKAELARRERAYGGGRPAPNFRGRTVIVADDGVATGSTMLVAIEALRRQGAGKIVAAVGVAPPDTIGRLTRAADSVVCLLTPEPFSAISLWFQEFGQTTDDEVRELLARTHPQPAG